MPPERTESSPGEHNAQKLAGVTEDRFCLEVDQSIGKYRGGHAIRWEMDSLRP